MNMRIQWKKWNIIPVPTCLNNVPNISGVYALYSDDRLIYIGSSGFLRKRIRIQVITNFKGVKITRVKFRIISHSSNYKRLQFERKLIERLNPIFNIQYAL